MFNLDEIKELVKLLDESSVQEIEIENEGSRVMIRKPNPNQATVVHSAPAMHVQHAAQIHHPAAAPPSHAVESTVSANDAAASNLHRIVSPMVGTFYRSPAPDAPSFVSTGDKVNEKTIVCIIEAMKLMNEIEAEVKGEIVEVLAENGQLVEFGQPLFLVKAE